MASKQHKTAIVTGGGSGIGLALVKHLLANPDTNWRVVIADIRADAWDAIKPQFPDLERVKFVQTDVADWDSNLSLFKAAYSWKSPGFHGERIDFTALNAGTGDREFVLQPTDLDADPEKPNTLCMDVNFTSVIYGVKLFVHFARKTKKAAAAHPHQLEQFNPNIVITASCVGIYKFPVAPQYNASKSACVAYTRAIGDALLSHENIAVNAIMPAYVDTPLVPVNLTKRWPEKYITPLSTMMRAYDELMAEKGHVVQDGKSDGKDGVVKTAQTVECVVDKLFYRDPVAPADESQAFLVRESGEGGLWGQAFKEMTGGEGLSQKYFDKKDAE
jgi:15-hydroxyprostaglandin dehydrogenase (NAD)